MLLTDRAPAKINLTLHVLGRRADGYHRLESLVAFSRSGDTLSLLPGDALKLSISGPTAPASGDPGDNLVLKAARNLAQRVEGLRLGAFHLVKNLPVAAGIGGGSSDAAAALRLLARANGLALDDPRLIAAATATGSDVPVCLAAKARMMTGVGESLGPVLDLPALPTLIVNPRQALATKDVFARMNISPGTDTGFGAHPKITNGLDSADARRALEEGPQRHGGCGLRSRACHRRHAGDPVGGAGLQARPHVGLGRNLLCDFSRLPRRRQSAAHDPCRASQLVGEGGDVELKRAAYKPNG